MLNSKIRSFAQKVTATATLGLPFLATCLVVAPLNALQGMPTFYRQKRYGQNGEEFKIWKFKSMRDGEGPDCDRITKLGKIIRKTSLDELPQLINIWNGEMDLVGARPLKQKRQKIWENVNFHLLAAETNTDAITPEMATFRSVKDSLDALEQIKPGIFGAVQISQYRGKYEIGDRGIFEKIARMEHDYLETRKRGHLAALWQDFNILRETPAALLFHPGDTVRDHNDGSPPIPG